MKNIPLRKLHVILIFLITLIYSCGSVTCLRHEEADYKEINQLLAEKEVILRLYDNKTVSTTCIDLKPDSTDIGGTRISTKEIFQIIHKNHAKGIRTGMYIGGSAGLLLGGAIGKGTTTSQTGAFSDFSVLPYAGVGSLVGIIAGGIIGGTSGISETITFISSAPQEKQLLTKQEQDIYIEFDIVREKGPDYIIILYQGRDIRLSRSEYKYRGTTNKGKQYILVYEDVFQNKFK